MIKKLLLNLTGLLFVAIALIGVFLPLLPTTPFLLMAAACFVKSSPYLHQKLLKNEIFGQLILNWQQDRSMPKKAKIIALISIILSVSWSCYLLKNIWLTLLLIALVTWPIVFIYRLPDSKS
jgi:uncharacterized membrane protein YbaN (DUF454 family)